MDKLKTIGKPIAGVKAIHSHAAAAAAKPEDAGGLESVLHIAEGAQVMLTCNLWREVGLCNGASGTIVSILYQIGHAPPSLPVAVVVHFPEYSGPTRNNTSRFVPIPPVTFEWHSGSQHYSRQLPIRLRYAITIHKSQGQTLSKAVIDIGKSERAAGSTYVAISRLRSLTDAIIEPMTLNRLLTIGNSKRLNERLRDDERLHQLAAITASS